MYERYGDRGVLEQQYPSMRDWVEAELARTDPTLLWLRGGQIGDHLDPTAPPETDRSEDVPGHRGLRLPRAIPTDCRRYRTHSGIL